MELKKDIKPIIDWSLKNGEAKIIYRILVRLMPEFQKLHSELKAQDVIDLKTLEVSPELYMLVKNTAEELVGSSFESQE